MDQSLLDQRFYQPTTEVFMNHPVQFLEGDNKTKLVAVSFSDLLELL